MYKFFFFYPATFLYIHNPTERTVGRIKIFYPFEYTPTGKKNLIIQTVSTSRSLDGTI